MTAVRQIPLAFTSEQSYLPEDFIVAPSNEHAYDGIMSWGVRNPHAALLIGEAESGKTHLAHCWAAEKKATILKGDSLTEQNIIGLTSGCFVILEDIDRGGYEAEQIFHLYNWVKEQRGYLLMTSRKPVTDLPFDLPDLLSRLKAALTFEIGQADDTLLEMLLVKMFSDRQVQVNYRLIDYILKRIPRRPADLKNMVAELDHRALAEGRAITTVMVRELLANKGAEI